MSFRPRRSHSGRQSTTEEDDMGRIVVSEFVTLDGVMEDPGGAEGFEHGGWAFAFDRGEEGDRYKLDEVMNADAMLLGRLTYEGFAAAWPERTDDGGFADKMNGMRKYVVSSTLADPAWNNSVVLGGDPADEAAKLRAEQSGDILVAGSRTLVQGLARENLVDEYRLMVFPTLLGSGKRLFGEGREPARLALVEATPVGKDGVVILTYRPAAAA
jgi:dihydrofolate reductase